MRKQSKKFLSLCLALVMALGLMAIPASACTADKDGNVTPCEKVEQDGYCDIDWLRGIDWEAGIMYQWPNPYYKAAPKPTETQKPSGTGGVTGAIKGSATYLTKEENVRSAISGVVGMDGDIVDWDNYTITRTWTGETCIWVLDPDTFIWTITNTVTGEISTSQDQKPKYWYVDDILIDTATGEPANGDVGNGRFYVNGVVADQANLESTQAEAPTANTAYASTQAVNVDGKAVTFECYALKDEKGNSTNYIKLRDLAMLLNGSSAQFQVGWDGSVTITTQTAYTPNGSELSTPYTGDRPYKETTAVTKVNGQTADLAAFILTDDQGGGYTYYQLRDLGQALGFNVGWSTDKGIFVETEKPYDPNN